MAEGEDVFAYDPETWKPVSLTYVEYPKGDRLGMLLAWASLLPIFLIVSFLTLIVMKRDIHTMFYFLGLMLNEPFNWILKNIFQEPRPVRGRRTFFTEFGMPSSHAQFMLYFSTYMMFFLLIRVQFTPGFLSGAQKYIWSITAHCVSVIVLISRVYLGYHTTTQVVCGAAVGMVTGAFWFYIVHNILTPYFPIITSWKISEFLMIRDSTLIPNVLRFEYTSNRKETKKHLQKSSS